MIPQFVITISKHRILGDILIPYLVSGVEGKNFLKILFRVTSSSMKTSDYEFSEAEKELVRITEEYDDDNLKQVFSKKKVNTQEFFSSISEGHLKDFVIPFIEKRIVKCIDILINSELKHRPIQLFWIRKSSNIHEEDRVIIIKEPVETVFNFTRTDETLTYFLTVLHNDTEMGLTGKQASILSNDPGRVLIENNIFLLKDINGKKLIPFFKRESVSIPKSAEKKYFETFIKSSIKKYKVNADGFEIMEQRVQPKALLSFENSLKGEPVIALKYQYGSKHKINYGVKNEPLVSLNEKDGRYSFTKVIRDTAAEDQIVNELTGKGLECVEAPHFRLQKTINSDIDVQKYEFINWINDHHRFLESNSMKMNQAYFDNKYYFDEISLVVQPKDSDDWFDIYAKVHFGEFQIPFIRLKKNILSGNREFVLPDGKIAILPEEWFTDYHDLLELGEEDQDNIKLNKHFFQVLNKASIGSDKRYLKKYSKLLKTAKATEKLPENINATLRPYQKEGYTWMRQLQNNGFGGCLADDMGLGKTLQTLTLILHSVTDGAEVSLVEQETGVPFQLSLFANSPVDPDKRAKPAASLIVVPTSLVHNWEQEIIKFTPDLTYYKHIGNIRSKNYDLFNDHNLVITSYGIVRNDINFFKKYKFLNVVLDESQYIKNPDSKTYKAVNQLDAIHRLVLTGTPIENSLKDLWSQMNFLNKGLLGNFNYFRETYMLPIEKKQDENQQKKLVRLIRPFILRRNKSEVEKDLPSLTEQVIFCKMSDSQHSRYEEEKSRIRNAILDLKGRGKLESSTFFVLQGLTRLRLIASHPVMSDPEYVNDSGKYEEVIQTIENLVAGNHKVLIFSSFVKHLKLFENHCQQDGIKYSMLTGNTRNRQQVIEEFQNNSDNQLFLISIKAGGTGLNLTSADYVFILDPWWNPAVESQAVSRAHRIGQNKKVFVYRFISKDTVEEKIMHLQKRKAELAEMFIKSNNPFQYFDINEILDLFG